MRRGWGALPLLLALAACAKPALSPRPLTGADAALAAEPLPSPTPTATPAYPQAKPLDQAKPVKVRSRSLKVGQAGASSVFYGGVTVTQDTTVLTARELRSRDQGRTALALGDVRLLDPERKVEALAQEVEYGDALRQASLRGHVRLLSVLEPGRQRRGRRHHLPGRPYGHGGLGPDAGRRRLRAPKRRGGGGARPQ
jgi:hypothetical protein